MWSSSGARTGLIALALATAVSLGACSGFRPVYGPGGVTQQQVALIYAAPTSRVEQVIYEDLALKLGKATSNAPTLKITAQSFSRDTTVQSTTAAAALPNLQMEMEVTADIKLTDVNGRVIFSGMRSATADYTTNSQGLANDAASADAIKRAADALADTIRLTILGALSK